MYNLTPKQKALLAEIVALVREGKIDETFTVLRANEGGSWIQKPKQKTGFRLPDCDVREFDALASANMLLINVVHQRFGLSECTLRGDAYTAVDSNFAAPDTSFVRHLTPLADVANLDEELRRRCLPILGAGAADPMLWDSAVRTAGVILEERLRDVGGISDAAVIGRDLVNKVFGATGSLAAKFAVPSERDGHRELFAGIVGVFRNPSAHRLIDPTPEDGGAIIVFVNLLLKKLDTFR